MSSQLEINQKALAEFRKKLEALGGSFEGSAERVLQRMAQVGLAVTKQNTPVKTGHLRRNWQVEHYHRVGDTHISGYTNNIEYAPYINNGHRVVSPSGVNVGFCEGRFMLEKGIDEAERSLPELFHEEIERTKREVGF